jgi:hypothetical protein
MSPILPRLAWSLLGLAVYAPIPVFAAFPELAPAALGGRFQGAPIGVWFVGGVIAAIVLLTWMCSLGTADKPAPTRGGAA